MKPLSLCLFLFSEWQLNLKTQVATSASRFSDLILISNSFKFSGILFHHEGQGLWKRYWNWLQRSFQVVLHSTLCSIKKICIFSFNIFFSHKKWTIFVEGRSVGTRKDVYLPMKSSKSCEQCLSFVFVFPVGNII